MRIFIVEDDMTSRLILQSFLQEYGHIDIAEEGLLAVKQFELSLKSAMPYDLICLDIALPGDIDGLKLLQIIRSLEKEYPTVPSSKVLMTTSNRDRKALMTSMKYHCDGYLLKPFDQNSLYEQLHRVGLIKS